MSGAYPGRLLHRLRGGENHQRHHRRGAYGYGCRARPKSDPVPHGCEETLWDIAKRYHTDEDAIRAANQLENDEDAAKYMLLIPRIR